MSNQQRIQRRTRSAPDRANRAMQLGFHRSPHGAAQRLTQQLLAGLRRAWR
jgi:hypothetical protein